MNGRVVEVSTASGQGVRKGERLVVLEAMKMEHVLGSPRDGEIESIEISVGDQVVPGQVLLRLKRES
jgi:3-methylcrotonyl-CoA carboxylase alpha subunit